MGCESYRELMVWQKSMQLAKACYVVSAGFPKSEAFGMTSQIRRSAASVAANIAEGQARGSKNEFVRFLHIARGSLAILETHLMLCCEVELVTDGDLKSLLSQCDEISRMLRGLQKSLA